MQTSEEKELIEHIRLRPGMYLGTLGNGKSIKDGIYRLFQEILNFSIDEFRQGYGNEIEVMIEDNQTISIYDSGTGLSFDERTWNGKPFLKASGITVDEVLVINMAKALCSHLEISFHKNGVASYHRYKNGILIEETEKETEFEDGTSIRFTPDETVFNCFEYVEDIVLQKLRNVTYLNEGLDIIFNGTRMRATDGMGELLADKKPHKSYYLYPIIHFKDEMIDVAITHSRYEGEECYSFVNGLYTNEGGTHLYAFKEAVASVVLELYPSDVFIPKDVYAGLVGAVSINMEHPMFNSVNRWRLESVYLSEDKSCTIKEFIHDFFYARFKEYLLEHKDVCDVILERITAAKKHRIFAEKCLSMSINQLVDLWNNGIETGELCSMELYAIRDAFLSKKVQTIEMQRSNAIGKRLKISYDKVFNIIHCSGRFFSETSGGLLQF